MSPSTSFPLLFIYFIFLFVTLNIYIFYFIYMYSLDVWSNDHFKMELALIIHIQHKKYFNSIYVLLDIDREFYINFIVLRANYTFISTLFSNYKNFLNLVKFRYIPKRPDTYRPGFEYISRHPDTSHFDFRLSSNITIHCVKWCSYSIDTLCKVMYSTDTSAKMMYSDQYIA